MEDQTLHFYFTSHSKITFISCYCDTILCEIINHVLILGSKSLSRPYHWGPPCCTHRDVLNHTLYDWVISACTWLFFLWQLLLKAPWMFYLWITALFHPASSILSEGCMILTVTYGCDSHLDVLGQSLPWSFRSCSHCLPGFSFWIFQGTAPSVVHNTACPPKTCCPEYVCCLTDCQYHADRLMLEIKVSLRWLPIPHPTLSDITPTGWLLWYLAVSAPPSPYLELSQAIYFTLTALTTP